MPPNSPLQDSTQVAPTVSGSGSSQVVFLESMAKGEKVFILAAVFIAIGLAVYAFTRVAAMTESLADYKRMSELHSAHVAETYRLQTETLAREYALQADALKTQFSNLERQSRMTELILDDWNVTARRAGLKLRGDYAHGPQGNVEAESFNMNMHKPRSK